MDVFRLISKHTIEELKSERQKEKLGFSKLADTNKAKSTHDDNLASVFAGLKKDSHGFENMFKWQEAIIQDKEIEEELLNADAEATSEQVMDAAEFPDTESEGPDERVPNDEADTEKSQNVQAKPMKPEGRDLDARAPSSQAKRKPNPAAGGFIVSKKQRKRKDRFMSDLSDEEESDD